MKAVLDQAEAQEFAPSSYKAAVSETLMKFQSKEDDKHKLETNVELLVCWQWCCCYVGESGDRR